MMSAAAQRDDRCFAAPNTVKGATLSKVSARLIRLGFVREIRAKAAMPVRRRGEAPQRRPLPEATIVCDPDNAGEQAKRYCHAKHGANPFNG